MNKNLAYEDLKRAWEQMKSMVPHPQVAPSSLFPFQSRYDACDMSTRTEHQILSEDWIHGITMGDNQYVVSREMWKIVRDKYPQYAVDQLEMRWPAPKFPFEQDCDEIVRRNTEPFLCPYDLKMQIRYG